MSDKFKTIGNYHEQIGEFIQRFNGLEFYISTMIIHKHSGRKEFSNYKFPKELKKDIFDEYTDVRIRKCVSIMHDDYPKEYKNYCHLLNNDVLMGIKQHRDLLAHSHVITIDQNKEYKVVVRILREDLHENDYKTSFRKQTHDKKMKLLKESTKAMTEFFYDIGLLKKNQLNK